MNASDINKRIFFVFGEDTCIGILAVTYIDDGFVSSYMPICCSVIDTDAENDTPFVLISDEEHLLYRSMTETVVLTGNTSKAISQNVSLAWTPCETLLLSRININTNRIEQSGSRGSRVLSVPIVANAISPDTGRGLCWTASMASIVRFRGAGGSSLSALELYNLLKTNYPSAGTPIGTATWIGRCFSLYSFSYSQHSSGMIYDSTKSVINNNLPILCELETSASTDQHAVVISGYENEYGYYYYTLMDPNCSGIVTVQITNTSATSFIYATTWGPTYTNWYYTMY